MLPIRTRSIFRSRWMALLWAGGILWSAVQFVGAQKDTPDGKAAAAGNDSVSAADQQAVVDALKAFGQ
jgi:hypothetical protein